MPDPAATLRRAAELAPKVLPAEIGALVAQKITLALDSPMRVADLHPFYGRLAAEVLALAEQQQAGRDAAIRLVAENQLRRYDSEVDAGHLSWVDFEPSAREDIDALAAAGQLRTAPVPSQPAHGDVYVHLTADELCDNTTSFGDRVNVDGGDDGPVGVEVLGAVKVTIDGRTVLPAMEPSGDVVEAVAREICNVGRDYDLWASDQLGESTRDDLRAEARAAISALRQPGGIINPAIQDVRLTPEELAALEARFKAAQPGRPAVFGSRPNVTRAEVRAAASALFEWNNELPGDPRFVLHHVAGGVDREPYGALVDEVLHHLGIRIREGGSDG